MSSMPLQEFYLLRKDNFPTFLKRTEKLGYKTDVTGLMGFTDEQLEFIKNQVSVTFEAAECTAIKAYKQAIKSRYGDLPIKINPSDYIKKISLPLELRNIGSIYLNRDDVSFETLKNAHERGVLVDFILQKHEKISDKMRRVYLTLRMTSLAGWFNRVDHQRLHDESKPQDYLVDVRKGCGELQTKLRELFEEIPQVVPIRA